MGFQNKGTCNERLFCYTEVQSAEYHYPFYLNISQCLCIFYFKGCGMGPWLVLVSPCFRENVVALCKIGSFLCSLDNLLQKNVIVLFFGNQI